MHLERVRERNNLKRTGQCVASRSSDSRSNFPNTRYPPGTRENLSQQLTHSKAVENWRRGWDSNPRMEVFETNRGFLSCCFVASRRARLRDRMPLPDLINNWIYHQLQHERGEDAADQRCGNAFHDVGPSSRRP